MSCVNDMSCVGYMSSFMNRFKHFFFVSKKFEFFVFVNI